MRSLRLPFLSALLGVAAGLSALPAAAHPDPDVHALSWIDEDPSDSPDDGDRLAGVVFAAARARFDDGIVRWRIEMRPETGGDPAFCDRTGHFGTDLTFRCNWDTSRIGDMTSLGPDQERGNGPVAPNGAYVITVTVWNAGRPQSMLSQAIPPAPHVLSPVRTVIVANPVSDPTGVESPSSAAPPAPPAPAPDPVPAQLRSGYWMVGSDGRVYPFGDARSYGNAPTISAVDLEPTPSGNGYWIIDDLGRVFAFGDAAYKGNVDRARLAAGEKATSLSATKSGNGYWIFTSRGRVLTFGDATFLGDVSDVPLNGPVLDSITAPSGTGYYMVASDGGIFAFGDAKFYGSMGGRPLNAPVQSLVPDADGVGYWLVAADGGIFAFEADFKGSMGSTPLNRPVTGMVRSGPGYVMVGEDGGLFDFSGTTDGYKGSLGANPPANPIVSVAVLEN